MLYMITYSIAEYIPGAYDDFFEALSAFSPRHQLTDTAWMVVSDAPLRTVAATLGAMMDERDCLYITRVEYDRFAGTITSALDRFISGYEHNARRYARTG